MKDGSKGADTGTLRKAIAKASYIAAHMKRSTHTADPLDGENRVQTATPARWNSEVKTLHSLLAASSEKLDLLDTAKLTACDRNIQEDSCENLSPFKDPTGNMQGQTRSFPAMLFRVFLVSKLGSISRNLTLMISWRQLSKTRSSAAFLDMKKRIFFVLVADLVLRFTLQWCTAVTHSHAKHYLCYHLTNQPLKLSSQALAIFSLTNVNPPPEPLSQPSS
ncbi:hypothetical protein Hamer_G017131 [Homarus americanus]|uniref:Uncharacterized protein n=1 Tax=Homarus americanus TaxID=6706 RepID=A0A8J5K0Q1_HOMAM|nr:hypothetical protein Hamer_G017131 [Homarus americanus]